MTEENTKPEIGDKMPDGTIFAGISPETDRPMYAAPADGWMIMDFNEAAKYAKGLEVGGKKGFRIPSKAELNALFQNREKGALKGTFSLSAPAPATYYWSSTPGFICDDVWAKDFRGGFLFPLSARSESCVRCIRYGD